jgi:hypothetical protein
MSGEWILVNAITIMLDHRIYASYLQLITITKPRSLGGGRPCNT